METDLSTTDKGIKDVKNNYRNMKDVIVSEANGTSPYMKTATFEWVYNTITSTVKKKFVEEIRNEPDKEKS